MTFTTNASGLVTLSVGASNIISKPGLSLSAINGAAVGIPPHPTILGTNAIQHGYPNLAAKYAYSMMAANVMQIQITLTNATSSPLSNPAFKWSTLNLAPTVTNDNQIGEAYFRNPANSAMFPGTKYPTHAFYQFNQTLGSCIHVKSHFRTPMIFDGGNLYVNCTIPPRGSVTIDVVWNVTSNTSFPGIFGPYLADYKSIIGDTKVRADNRVCFQAYVSSDPSQVNAQNPYGYSMIRPDTPDGIDAAIAMLTPAIGKTQGIFIVDPAGVDPRQQQVRSEWLDTLPPETQQNLPTLISWCNANGIGFGIGVRPSAIIVRGSYGLDQSWALDESQYPYVGQRIKNALAMGLSGPIYLDSIGLDLADADLIAYIRGVLGNTIPIYSETWTALTIRDSGIYQQNSTTSQQFSAYSLTDCQLARFLQPNVNIVSLGVGLQPADHIAACRKFGYAPLFDAYSAGSIIPLMG